jgi:RNA polymerase sigma-70 factor (ECF subfamily)
MDSSHCERLWKEHADTLLLYATTIVTERELAEDVLQIVFARLLGMTSLPPLESEASYLYQAVRNEAISALRSRRRMEGTYQRLLERLATDDAFRSGGEDRSPELESALFEIPREQREAIVLKVWGDLTFEEAAAVMGISAKTFEHRYYRGLATLKDELEGRYE